MCIRDRIESVHREVNRQALDIKKGCERDIRKVDDRLRLMEKKMWTIAGSIAVISFLVSPVGQRLIRPLLTNGQASARVVPLQEPPVELSRYKVS